MYNDIEFIMTRLNDVLSAFVSDCSEPSLEVIQLLDLDFCSLMGDVLIDGVRETWLFWQRKCVGLGIFLCDCRYLCIFFS